MTDRTTPYRITITEIDNPVLLHLNVKKTFPVIYRRKAGSIKIGEFVINYGIDEAQKTLKLLTDSGAKAKIEPV